MAKAFGLKGWVENLADGRVKIIAEGDEEKLKWFESSIDIKNTLIEVSSIEKAYSPAREEFSKFMKFVDDDETDARLDKGVEAIGSMIQAVNGVTKAIENMDLNLSRRMDNLGEKIDVVGGKIDNLGEKMDTIGGKIDVVSGKIDNLGEKVDTIGGKIDRIDGKMGSMLQKQDDLIVEVKDMNSGLNEKMDRVLDKTDVVELKSDMSDVKAALRAKGII